MIGSNQNSPVSYSNCARTQLKITSIRQCPHYLHRHLSKTVWWTVTLCCKIHFADEMINYLKILSAKIRLCEKWIHRFENSNTRHRLKLAAIFIDNNNTCGLWETLKSNFDDSTLIIEKLDKDQVWTCRRSYLSFWMTSANESPGSAMPFCKRLWFIGISYVIVFLWKCSTIFTTNTQTESSFGR